MNYKFNSIDKFIYLMSQNYINFYNINWSVNKKNMDWTKKRYYIIYF